MADPGRALAISYALSGARAPLAALFALDDVLGAILRTTREPIVGQMRLTWWHGALTTLDDRAPPAEPVLQALSMHVLPRGVSGARLATLIDGWEALLDDPIDAMVLDRFAHARGAALFAIAGLVLGADDARLEQAGEGWALADLARHTARPAVAAQARAIAEVRLSGLMAARWSRAARPLGALALMARADLAATRRGSLTRVGRLLIHRLFGI